MAAAGPSLLKLQSQSHSSKHTPTRLPTKTVLPLGCDEADAQFHTSLLTFSTRIGGPTVVSGNRHQLKLQTEEEAERKRPMFLRTHLFIFNRPEIQTSFRTEATRTKEKCSCRPSAFTLAVKQKSRICNECLLHLPMLNKSSRVTKVLKGPVAGTTKGEDDKIDSMGGSKTLQLLEDSTEVFSSKAAHEELSRPCKHLIEARCPGHKEQVQVSTQHRF